MGCADNFAAESFSDGLVTETDAENRDFASKVAD
jgi:hypothetical protein